MCGSGGYRLCIFGLLVVELVAIVFMNPVVPSNDCESHDAVEVVWQCVLSHHFLNNVHWEPIECSCNFPQRMLGAYRT